MKTKEDERRRGIIALFLFGGWTVLLIAACLCMPPLLHWSGVAIIPSWPVLMEIDKAILIGWSVLSILIHLAWYLKWQDYEDFVLLCAYLPTDLRGNASNWFILNLGLLPGYVVGCALCF